MKKLMFAAATAAALVGKADIESTNIVGYNSMGLKTETYVRVSVQFDDVATGVGEGYAIKDLIKGEVPYGTSISILKADGTYDIYKYIEEAYDEVIDDFIPGWADGGENLAVAKVEPGTTFWLKAPSETTATISGQVLSDASKKVEIVGGKYSMVGNPYPAEVNPNALAWTSLSFGDSISVLKDDGTYDIYKYIEESYDEELDDFVPGWADGGENKVTGGIMSAGQGAWINPAKTVTLEWVSPVAK